MSWGPLGVYIYQSHPLHCSKGGTTVISCTTPHNFTVSKTMESNENFDVAALNAFLSLEKLDLPWVNMKLEWIFIFDRRYIFPILSGCQ